MSNEVKFQFTGTAAQLPISFVAEAAVIENPKGKKVDGDKETMPIPLSKITSWFSDGCLTVSFNVGRDGNKNVAKWYMDSLKDITGIDRPRHMMHTAKGSNVPDKLNFAVRGTLIIGEEKYPVCFGQGHYGSTNNWHFCAPRFLARKNNKTGYLDAFFMEGDGSHTFETSFVNEAAGKSVGLWTCTDAENMIPRYDMEGDRLQPFPYKPSGLGQTGAMQHGNATTSGNTRHRDFHLQITGGAYVNILYKIDRWFGGIQGNDVSQQTVLTYEDSNRVKYVLNYGMSHAAQPLTNQSYIYTGRLRENWLGDLTTQCKGLEIQDLVMAGSHDAGMYVMNSPGLNKEPWFQDMVLKYIGDYVTRGEVAAFPPDIALANVGCTQKDTAYNQMMIGTRFFDFRPAYLKTTPAAAIADSTYHVHNFIQGVRFKDFLVDIMRYLNEKGHEGEIAIIELSDAGIDTDVFACFGTEMVEDLLGKLFPKDSYQLLPHLSALHGQTVESVVKSGRRLIVLEDGASVNSSYKSGAYSSSLTDPSAVIAALDVAIARTGNYDYTCLALQDTGSGALEHYKSSILSHPMSWANDLGFSKSGNLLQATKPIFDNATYTWLTKSKTWDGINRQQCPVIISNDFVDVIQAGRATALTKAKYAARVNKRVTVN